MHAMSSPTPDDDRTVIRPISANEPEAEPDAPGVGADSGYAATEFAKTATGDAEQHVKRVGTFAADGEAGSAGSPSRKLNGPTSSSPSSSSMSRLVSSAGSSNKADGEGSAGGAVDSGGAGGSTVGSGAGSATTGTAGSLRTFTRTVGRRMGVALRLAAAGGDSSGTGGVMAGSA